MRWLGESEQRNLPVAFTMPATSSPDSEFELARVWLSYWDHTHRRRSTTRTVVVSVPRLAGPSPSAPPMPEEPPLAAVRVALMRGEAAEVIGAAARAAKDGRPEDAWRMVQHGVDRVERLKDLDGCADAGGVFLEQLQQAMQLIMNEPFSGGDYATLIDIATAHACEVSTAY